MERIFAIPDIHGCLKKLDTLIVKLKLKDDDRLIFLGDYIDRGPHSARVIKYLINLNKNTNCKFLIGNHEWMMYQSLNHGNKDIYKIWIKNGGHETLNSYKIHNHDIYSIINKWDQIIPDEHKHFFKNLESFYELDDFVFVHAGINLEIPLYDNSPDDYLWIRPPFFHGTSIPYPLNKMIIHGHTPTNSIDFQSYRIGIDLGAFKIGQPLIAFNVFDNSFMTGE